MAICNGKRKLFLKEFLPKGTNPERYLTRVSSAEVGWIDMRPCWICDGGEVISFSEGNGQQEILALLPLFGWISAARGLFHLIPDEHRPWRAAFKYMNNGGHQ